MIQFILRHRKKRLLFFVKRNPTNQKNEGIWRYKNYFHSCTVKLDTIESFIYPTDAQLDCSKNAKIYIKLYMGGVLTCFGFSQPSSGSYCMCFAKVKIVNLFLF
jgi:hypothetical protein